MPKPRQLTSEVQAVYSGLFARFPSRSERRVIQILEAAIRNYVKIGIENTTYDSIARTCKVSRPLVQHYFKDHGELFEMVTKYVRSIFQQVVVEEMRREKSPRRQLEAYLGAIFVWKRKYPLHVKVWNLVYYYAAINKGVRKIHTALVNMGQARVVAVLELGVAQGEFPSGDLRKRAKQILTLLLGAIAVLPAEDLEIDLPTYRKQLIEAALTLADAKT